MNILCISILLLISSCSSKKVTTTTGTSAGRNNQVIVKSQNSIHNSTGDGKVTFEGENNLIEISYDSSVYEGKDNKTVTIVKGNQNNIQVTQNNVQDYSENKNDTTYIIGNNQKINLAGKDIVVNRSGTSEKSLIAQKSNASKLGSVTISQNASSGQTNLVAQTKSLVEDSLEYFKDTSLIEIEEIQGPVQIRDALSFYLNEIRNGNTKAYYKIGLFFQLGIGTKVNSLKAEEYFEIAARNGVSEAQMNLGYFYEVGFWYVKPNRQKALYYYRMAAAQGNKNAEERLIEMGE